MSDRIYERFQFLVNAPALFNAVVTAFELHIFRFLAEHPESSFEQIRAFTGIPAHQLRVLLQAVCSTELVRRTGGCYANSDVAERLLTSDPSSDWGSILVGWRDFYYPAFAEMTPALRAGTNTALLRYAGDEPTLYQRLAHDPERQAVFHAAMAAFTRCTLPALLDNLDLAPARHLLDVGGGDGTTATPLAERHPDLRVTVFDMPSVAALAGDANRVCDRVRFQTADLFDDEFPTGVDAVLFSHVLEIFSAERIVALLTKAYRALPPGGRAFVYGFHVSDDETAGIFSARLSLYLNVLASGQGMAYPAADYASWMRRAGFERVETVRGLPFEHGLITGTRA